MIFENIKITQPSLCEHITHKSNNQLLIRPFVIYEIPKNEYISKSKSLTLTNQINYRYKTNKTGWINKRTSIPMGDIEMGLAGKTREIYDIELTDNQILNIVKNLKKTIKIN